MSFLDKILNEPEKQEYSKKDLLKEEYRVGGTENLEMYYAPFDYINEVASIIIVGITPGWTQMEKSFRSIIFNRRETRNKVELLKKVKNESSFAGSMRNNLVKMLDDLNLNRKLGVNSCELLFSENTEQLHSTSILKYPVFNNGKNYTGSAPSPLKNKFLWDFIENNFVPEINRFENKLVIPLGKNVSDVLEKLKFENRMSSNSILTGFPHPSGANGHRKKQYYENKEAMMDAIEKWK